MGKVIFRKGKWVKVPDVKKGNPSMYGTLRGKVIKKSYKDGVFVQVDKNGQINDMFVFYRLNPVEDRIGERIRGWLFDKYHGRLLYSNFQELVNDITSIKEEENG